MKTTVHVFVSGRVQGVSFRSWTDETAKSLGLNGWVRNLPDGRVEAMFEGETSKVRKMVELCKKGPAHAKVENVEVRKESISGLASFEVR